MLALAGKSGRRNMKLTVEITAKRPKAPSPRELQSFNAELASALKLIGDHIANAGLSESSIDFHFGAVKGRYIAEGSV